MKTQQMMETSHWFCIYLDHHDKPHSKIFDDKQDAMAEMKKIKRRIQKSSAYGFSNGKRHRLWNGNQIRYTDSFSYESWFAI